MKHTEISILETFDNEPVTITLDKWLKANLTGDKYLETIRQYRATGDTALKKSLPLAIVGSVCQGGHAKEHVVSRTGWIAVDIDDADESKPFNAARVRNEIAKISFVAFAALSCSGNGVWALIRVKNPEKQSNYFDQIVNDFNHIIARYPAIFENAKIDTGKGKNPNDKRFLSYDPDAVIKNDWQVYDRLPIPKKAPKKRKYVYSGGDSSRYADAAFRDEINILSSTTEGNRNSQLFKSSASLAGLVAGGILNELEVKEALRQTALSTGLNNHEVDKTLASGFNTGIKTPRTPEAGKATPALKKDRASQGSQVSPKPILNDEGIPADWNVPPPEPGTDEYREMENEERKEAA